MIYDMTAVGAIIRGMTDETRAAWWWLFRIYGADEAIRLIDKWWFEARKKL